jgi:hypothetical protein
MHTTIMGGTIITITMNAAITIMSFMIIVKVIFLFTALTIAIQHRNQH